MALKISNSGPFKNHYLKVESDGVTFCETAIGRNTRRFRYRDIVCVLMSPAHTLSFQVGQEVFSIPTQPEDPGHQKVVAALLSEARRSLPDQEPSG